MPRTTTQRQRDDLVALIADVIDHAPYAIDDVNIVGAVMDLPNLAQRTADQLRAITSFHYRFLWDHLAHLQRRPKLIVPDSPTPGALIAALAPLFDTDHGALSNRGTLLLGIAHRHVAALETLCRTIGGRLTLEPAGRPPMWRVTGATAYIVGHALLPHIRGQRDGLQRALDTWERTFITHPPAPDGVFDTTPLRVVTPDMIADARTLQAAGWIIPPALRALLST